MNGGDADSHQRGRTGFDNRTAQQSSPPAAKGKQKSLQVVVTSYDSSSSNNNNNNGNDDEAEDEGDNDTVGSLLAEIANILADALRMLMFADKRHWASDEFEQVRAFEETLDEAKGDFQELGPLLKGSFYYENDRRRMFGPYYPLVQSQAGFFSPLSLSALSLFHSLLLENGVGYAYSHPPSLQSD